MKLVHGTRETDLLLTGPIVTKGCHPSCSGISCNMFWSKANGNGKHHEQEGEEANIMRVGRSDTVFPMSGYRGIGGSEVTLRDRIAGPIAKAQIIRTLFSMSREKMGAHIAVK